MSNDKVVFIKTYQRIYRTSALVQLRLQLETALLQVAVARLQVHDALRKRSLGCFALRHERFELAGHVGDLGCLVGLLLADGGVDTLEAPNILLDMICVGQQSFRSLEEGLSLV